MNTKLTLRLDEDLIENAKKAAQSRGLTLSGMVADYFRHILKVQEQQETVSPVLSEIAGVLSTEVDNKRLLNSYKKHLEDKYLR